MGLTKGAFWIADYQQCPLYYHAEREKEKEKEKDSGQAGRELWGNASSLNRRPPKLRTAGVTFCGKCTGVSLAPNRNGS